MLNTLKNFKGQGVIVQYAMTFTVVLGIIMGMSTYFKRVVQSRIKGAKDYAASKIVKEAFSNPSLNLIGNFQSQYEPYYTQSQMVREIGGSVTARETGGVGVAPINEREHNDYYTKVNTVSNQLAPKYED